MYLCIRVFLPWSYLMFNSHWSTLLQDAPLPYSLTPVYTSSWWWSGQKCSALSEGGGFLIPYRRNQSHTQSSHWSSLTKSGVHKSVQKPKTWNSSFMGFGFKEIYQTKSHTTMERICKHITTTELQFLRNISDILKPLPWFEDVVVTGSMAYGTDKKDFVCLFVCFSGGSLSPIECSPIGGGSPYRVHCSTITRGPKNCKKGTQFLAKRGPFLT